MSQKLRTKVNASGTLKTNHWSVSGFLKWIFILLFSVGQLSQRALISYHGDLLVSRPFVWFSNAALGVLIWSSEILIQFTNRTCQFQAVNVPMPTFPYLFLLFSFFFLFYFLIPSFSGIFFFFAVFLFFAVLLQGSCGGQHTICWPFYFLNKALK